MKLSKYQRELLDAIHAGVLVHYVLQQAGSAACGYYFRSDTMRRCTRAALALLEWGVVEHTEGGAEQGSLLVPRR